MRFFLLHSINLHQPTFLLRFIGNFIFIKEARANVSLKASIFLMCFCCPCSGQMGNILSEWDQASEFKGKPSEASVQANHQPSHSVPSVWAKDAILHLKQCLINSIRVIKHLSFSSVTKPHSRHTLTAAEMTRQTQLWRTSVTWFPCVLWWSLQQILWDI